MMWLMFWYLLTSSAILYCYQRGSAGERTPWQMDLTCAILVAGWPFILVLLIVLLVLKYAYLGLVRPSARTRSR
jgi:hypothetical protein